MDREISIQVPAFDSFVTEYSANISTTGMFIKSDKPLPPETEITLEFKIAEDWKLIRGDAKVVWSRYRAEGPDQPAGMGVQFIDLEPQSKRLIGWIIEKHIREGGTPFDLDALKGPPPELTVEPSAPGAAAAPAATQPIERPHLRSDRPVRRRGAQAASATARFPVASLIIAAIAVAALLGGLFWLSERSAQTAANPELPADTLAVEAPEATATQSAGESVEAGESGPEAESTAAGSIPQASPVFLEAAKRVVEGWSRAWSEQDVDAYLSYYSRNFEPASGQSRSAWAARRRERLQAPEFVQITVSDLDTEAVGENRGRVTFDQGYRSDTFQDNVRKVLELVREDGRWKILAERSSG